jgi:hypothetical protein
MRSRSILAEAGVFIIGAGIVPFFFDGTFVLAIIFMIAGSFIIHFGAEPFLKNQKGVPTKFLLGLYMVGFLFGVLIIIGIFFNLV